jgi:FAD-linked sulfhydryl oxidase
MANAGFLRARSGECAQHFGQILDKFPPQIKSRSTAAAWGCHVHNEVNKSLRKELWDCSKIGDFYDCGCAEDGKDDKDGKGAKKEARGVGTGPLGLPEGD